MIFNYGVALTGVLVIIFGIALREQLPPKRFTKIGCGLLVLGGLGLIGSGYFHCNVGCRNILIEPDIIGRLHTIMSVLSGMGTGLAPFFIWAAIRNSDKWKSFATLTFVAAILANLPGIIFWITILTGFRLPTVEGLIQRMGFVVVLIWIFFASAKLWRLMYH